MGATIRVVLSPTPPVECLSTIFSENGKVKEDGYERSCGGGYINDYRDAAQHVVSEYENVIFMDNLEKL